MTPRETLGKAGVDPRAGPRRKSAKRRSLSRAEEPQKQAVFQPQLSKITKDFGTLDSSFAVSTLRLPDARWSSLVARRAHNPKVGGSNPPRATRRKGPEKSGPFYFLLFGGVSGLGVR